MIKISVIIFIPLIPSRMAFCTSGFLPLLWINHHMTTAMSLCRRWTISRGLSTSIHQPPPLLPRTEGPPVRGWYRRSSYVFLSFSRLFPRLCRVQGSDKSSLFHHSYHRLGLLRQWRWRWEICLLHILRQEVLELGDVAAGGNERSRRVISWHVQLLMAAAIDVTLVPAAKSFITNQRIICNCRLELYHLTSQWYAIYSSSYCFPRKRAIWPANYMPHTVAHTAFLGSEHEGADPRFTDCIQAQPK
jgi:hypothetical protein